MKLIKRSEKAKEAHILWESQYFRGGVWLYGAGKQNIHEALVALGSEPSADDVDRVIGNTSWTQCRCDECDTVCEEVIQVGQEPDYDSSTAELCFDCVLDALVVIHGQK